MIEHERWREYYQQPGEILDVVWEYLHTEDVLRDERSPFKSITQMALAGVEPHDISHLIDVAITAYRWRGVPSGRFLCTYCGDQTERDEDPDPRVCAMCVKLPGRASPP